MGVSKVAFNGTTLIDISDTTATASTVLTGSGCYGADGQWINGTATSSESITLQNKNKSYTPTETIQSETVTADSGYDGLSSVAVSVGAISTTYVGSGITQRSSSDLTASGATVTVPVGYYAAQASKAVANGSATPAASISATSATVTTGTNTLTLSKTVSNTPQVSAGYIASGTAGNSSVSLTASVSTRSSSDLTASGATVTAPAGYYATAASKSVASGTEGTPTATKGTVSNNSVSVTPSVTNTTGYITGSTKTGTAVTVSASELVSGTKSITANGNGIDVTNYASVDVAVSGGNDFVIVMSEDGQGNPVLDKTFAEISTAYYAGKNIVVQSELYYPTNAEYLDGDDCLLVEVCIPDYEWSAYSVKGYNFYSNNMIPEDYGTFYLSDGTTAVPSDVANGKTFINADGWQTGTASSSVPTIQSLSVTPTTSQQTFNASGVDGYKPVTVSAMPSGSATAPASISGTSATVSTGTNTLTLTKSVSVTPSVTAGYVSSGTAGNSSVSLTASVTTKAAATITPSTSNQTIASGTYLTGTQTISGDANLVGSNIISGKSIFGVAGTVQFQTIYTGSSNPSSSTGSNGDIYLKVVS